MSEHRKPYPENDPHYLPYHEAWASDRFGWEDDDQSNEEMRDEGEEADVST